MTSRDLDLQELVIEILALEIAVKTEKHVKRKNLLQAELRKLRTCLTMRMFKRLHLRGHLTENTEYKLSTQQLSPLFKKLGL
jgi:hypothetical protein